MTSLTIDFPWPPDALRPNARPKLRAKMSAVTHYRNDCGWIAKAAMMMPGQPIRFPLPPPVTAHVTFVFPDSSRMRDEPNLLASIGPLFNGLKDAGLIIDDHSGVFHLGAPQVEVGLARVVRVRLEASE